MTEEEYMHDLSSTDSDSRVFAQGSYEGRRLHTEAPSFGPMALFFFVRQMTGSFEC